MWYPPIEPYECGLLDVDGGHRLYWETSGNPAGKPVLFLHGGPGGGCTPDSRRWFDPRRYRIIAFDQRGCGRSTPHASIEHNTTAHLVSDIEALREVLGVERWMIMGRSWGATLALAYAQQRPDRVMAMVLSGIFTARQSELDWLYRGGAATRVPHAWLRFVAPLGVEPEQDPIAAYHARLNSGDSTAELQAARSWCEWEHALTTRLPVPLSDDEPAIRARARIQAHFFLHRAFLDDGRLLADARRLRRITGVIVQGADDMVTPPSTAMELHQAWPGSVLQMVPEAGHRSTEPGIMRALIDAADAIASNFR
jgi:proline iminopeptidase